MSALESHTTPAEIHNSNSEEAVPAWPHMMDEEKHMEIQVKLTQALAVVQGWGMNSSGMSESDEEAFARWMFDDNKRSEKLRVMIRHAYGSPEALRDTQLKDILDNFIASTVPKSHRKPSMSAEDFEALLDEKGVEEN